MAKFVTDLFSEQEANVVVLSVRASESLRTCSQLVEPFDINKQKNLLENVKIFDAGEVNENDVTEKTKQILTNKKFPLILGNEHTVALNAIKALSKDAKLIIFDAHADLKEEYEGSKLNHATWIRAVCRLVNPKNITIVGVRSCDEDELNFMKKSSISYFTTKQIKQSSEVKDKLKEFSPAYVSIDMDVFDPSIAPAVKYPEPDGLLYSDFVELVQNIKPIGLDVTEIKPLGENRITEFLAVKVIFQLLGLIYLAGVA